MFGIVLFIVIFVFYCHLASEWEHRHAPTGPVDDLPQPELLEEAAVPVETHEAPAMAAPMAAPVAIAVVPAEPDYAAMNSTQLRKECSLKGIRWRNAHGKGKHLKKGEMLKALGG
jgi:hypothetical protein